MRDIPEVAASRPASPEPRPRYAYVDTLKVLLVTGVIVAHVTMAWTGVGNWVFQEPRLREPLLSLLTAVVAVGALFGMAFFFLIAGIFAPRSLARKGLRRFLVDRAVRLGVPMVFFMIVLSPVVEYVDPENAGWDRGFPRFAVHVWAALVPGPTWFLGVLLVFSVMYALARSAVPAASRTAEPLRTRDLVTAAAVVAVASYLVRLGVPIGAERWHLALAQAPGWTVGFLLGVVGGERSWFHCVRPAMSRGLFRSAWAAVACTTAVVGAASAAGADPDVFAGGGTWQSLALAVLEGGLVVAMSLWLLDVFHRRVDHQGRLLRGLSRAAFAAFIVHQVVLVGLVLLTHRTPWPPEVEYLGVCVLGVAGSFVLAALVVRLPGVSRIV